MRSGASEGPPAEAPYCAPSPFRVGETRMAERPGAESREPLTPAPNPENWPRYGGAGSL